MNKILTFFSAAAAAAAIFLVLYAYPLAGIDPTDAYPFYTHPLYLKICVPYGVAFLCLSVLVLIRKSRTAALILLAVFLISHVHMKWIFPEIAIKPVFAGVFILIPALAFLATTVTLWRKSPGHD